MDTPKKLTRKQKDEHLAAKLPGLLQYHHLMLSDGVRNKLLADAITKHVTRETNFLDIGAGTGVWAILAAKLGAKRVVAVEIEEPLIPIIYKHAKENGVAHKIEIIHGNSDDVKIRGKFDVIVSELFGNDALGEATTKSFVSLRNRFLAPSGILIPQKLQMLAVPVRLEKSVENIPAGLDISCKFLKSLKVNYSQMLSIDDRPKTKFLAEPKLITEIDFHTVENAPSLKNISLSWEMEDLSAANAFAVFNHHTFTDEFKMDSFNSQSWGATAYEFQTVEAKKGTIKFDISMDGTKSVWAVTTISENGSKTQHISPAFTAARIKMAQQTTPHRKFKPKKKNVTQSKNSK